MAPTRRMRPAKRRRMMPLLLSEAVKRRNSQSGPAQLRKKVLKSVREQTETRMGAAFAGCNQ